MRQTLILLATIAALGAGAAQAQPGGIGRDRDRDRGGPPSATLYELPNFQGRSVTITEGAPDLGQWRFNDRARSARFNGSWRICEHDRFRGRCQDVRGDLAELNSVGLAEQISSLEPTGFGGGGGGRPPGPGPGGGWDGRDRDQRGVDGVRTVFFPRPTVRGLDLAAARSNADQFCARQGHGRSVYYDTSERARQSMGPDGGMVSGSAVIRDLLCQKY